LIMEQTTNYPIVITVYYRQSNWHSLLQFIHPHLKRHIKSNVRDWYCIELGNHQGDYVRFVIYSSGNRENLVNLFSEKIKNYLEDHPSDTVEAVYPLRSYFMDYPNNSVWIDHNRSFKFNYAFQNLNGVHMQISKILIIASENEPITFESICTVFVYMQLGIISAFCPHIDEAATMVNALIPIEAPASLPSTNVIEQKDAINDLFEQLFKENIDILMEMVNDVWQRGDSENELLWITDWKNVVKNAVGDSDMHAALFKLSELIYKQMIFLENTHLPQLSLRLIASVLAAMKDRSSPLSVNYINDQISILPQKFKGQS